MPKVATMFITFITLLLAFIRFRFQYFNVLDELSSHRLGLFYAVPTPTARNLLLSQHSFICISPSAFALFALQTFAELVGYRYRCIILLIQRYI